MAGQIRYEKGKLTIKREPGKNGLKLGVLKLLLVGSWEGVDFHQGL